MMMVFSACAGTRPSATVSRLEAVYEARSARNATQLLVLTTSADTEVRALAWTGLGNMDVPDSLGLFGRVAADGSAEAWFALSQQRLPADTLRLVEALWHDRAAERAHLALVLGKTGDAVSRAFLNTRFDPQATDGVNRAVALAISRLNLVLPPDEALYDRLIASRVPVEALYGFYRLPRPVLTQAQQQALFGRLSEPEARQYVVGILGKTGHTGLSPWLAGQDWSAHDTRFAVEALRALNRMPEWSLTEWETVAELATHTNPSVVKELMDLLSARPHTANGQRLALHVAETTTHEAVRIAALRVVATADRAAALGRIPAGVFPTDPYLTLDALRLTGLPSEIDSLDRNTVAAWQTVTYLGESLPLTEAAERHLRRYVEHADLRVAATAVGILASQSRFGADDSLRYRAVLDSIAVHNRGTDGLLIADADLLARFGRRPVWTLVTDLGTVRMVLYPDAAPATVTGFIAATLAGSYTGSWFHRVIPNFVVQGGQFVAGTRADPPFTLPTEAAGLAFTRGKVGVASSGRDTEGGQFFIMLQDMPHLDRNYTICGEVVEGMEVVDRMTNGTRIRSAAVSPGE